MAASLWNVDWSNANSQRKYPLSEVATGMDISGTYRLPDDFLVGAALAVHFNDASLIGRYLLMSIGVFGDTIRAVIGYVPIGATEPVALGNVTVNRATHIEYSGYTFDNGDPRGSFAIGKLDEVIDRGGFFQFDLAGAALEPCVARPSMVGVRSIQLIGGTPALPGDRIGEFTGDVRLVAGTNVRYGTYGNGVVINAGFRDGMVDQPDTSVTPLLGDPVRMVNGQAPDASGNIVISGDDCIQVSNVNNGVSLQDRCSSSCCGCSELNRIMLDLNNLNSQIIGLEGLINSLETTMLQSLSTIVASKAQNIDIEGRSASVINRPIIISPPPPVSPPAPPDPGGPPTPPPVVPPVVPPTATPSPYVQLTSVTNFNTNAGSTGARRAITVEGVIGNMSSATAPQPPGTGTISFTPSSGFIDGAVSGNWKSDNISGSYPRFNVTFPELRAGATTSFRMNFQILGGTNTTISVTVSAAGATGSRANVRS